MSVRTDVLVDLQALPNKLNLGIGILGKSSQSLLDTLHLLRDSTQNTFLQPVELVKASPGPHLTEANKNATHGLEIKRLVATEYQHKAAELDTKGLDGFCFA